MQKSAWFGRVFLAGIALTAQCSHAQYTTDFQTNIISGVTSNWSGDYVVGSNTVANALLIANSGVLSNGSGYVGYEVSSSNNSVLVTDNGSVWSNSGTLCFGRSGAGNSLVISNAGQVINTTGIMGYNSSSSNNTGLVSDAGSVWSNANLYVGYSGFGNSLVISNGGWVFGDGYLGGTSSSRSNSVLVIGTGTVWRGSVTVGNNSSSNILVIRNGGCVLGRGQGAIGGAFSSSNNTVLVTDSGSIWSNSYLTVGGEGWGSRLVVSNGAQVLNAGLGYVGASDFPRLGSNTVLVTGSGSVWSNGSDWQVGGYMWGNSVVVNNGGLLINNYNGYVGAYPESSSNNSLLVSDVGSVWTNLGDLYVGDGGSRNSMTVSNGAKVFSGYSYL
jgi:autotransporter family porin